MSSLTFLGTGGGRFVTLSQVRRTAGIWLEADGRNLLIDPGVGTLIYALEAGKELVRLDAILVSHKHLDHYNDAEVCLEGMTDAMNMEKGTLFVNENVAPYISDYHKSMVDFRTFASPGKHEIAGIEVETIPTFDHDDAFGFKFHLKDGVITYASDTNYNKDLVQYYKGSDILILNVLRPDEKKILKHLSVGEAARLIQDSRPKTAVLTHFGYLLATTDTDSIARDISEATGVETIAARDGIVLEL